MKITMAVLALALCLIGCGRQPSYETLGDNLVQMTEPQQQKVLLELPEDSNVPAISGEGSDQMYLCDGFSVSVQTFPGGDLDKTLRETTGYGAQELRLIETKWQNTKCYDCVWTAAGEGSTQTGRLRLLDDGSYHYVVTVMADAELTGQLQPQINTIMRSAQLVSQDFQWNTGS